MQIEKDITYAVVTTRQGSLDLKLDVVRPDTRELLPVLIWFHGGGWREGSKDNWHPNAVRLAEQGFAVVSANYRLSGQAIFPAQIHDAKSTVRWIRANAKQYAFDPDRIGAIGGSAGAHLASLLGMTNNLPALEGDGPNRELSSAVQAVFPVAAPTDLLRVADDHPPEHSLVHVTSALLGGPIKQRADLARLASPMTYVAPHNPPHFLLHGNADTTVPCVHSQILHDALKKLGVAVELVLVDKGTHGSGMPDSVPMIVEFFRKHLA